MSDWRHNDGGMRRWWNYQPSRPTSLPIGKQKAAEPKSKPEQD